MCFVALLFYTKQKPILALPFCLIWGAQAVRPTQDPLTETEREPLTVMEEKEDWLEAII